MRCMINLKEMIPLPAVRSTPRSCGGKMYMACLLRAAKDTPPLLPPWEGPEPRAEQTWKLEDIPIGSCSLATANQGLGRQLTREIVFTTTPFRYESTLPLLEHFGSAEFKESEFHLPVNEHVARLDVSIPFCYPQTPVAAADELISDRPMEHNSIPLLVVPINPKTLPCSLR